MSNMKMRSDAPTVQPRFAALTAGVGMLAMTLIAAPVNFIVIQNMIVPGGAEATAANLVASAGVYRLAALALLVVAFLDVLVAWGLYEMFKRVHPGLSLLGAWLRIVYATIFAASIVSIFEAVRAAPADAAAALRFVQHFTDGWMVGQFFFGIHLGVVGVLALRSHFIHWLFGVLLVVAGAGYFVDGIATLASPAYTVELAMFTFVGEVLFMFWLLIRGPRLPAASAAGVRPVS